MSLYERWTGIGGAKIHVHAFGAALCELADNAITQPQIVSQFSLSAAEETELDAIITKYQGLATEILKARFLVKLENVMILVEEQIYNETKAKSELGF
jgi:hypothetical protein